VVAALERPARADVHDLAAAGLLHMRHNMLAHQINALERNVDREIPVAFGKRLDRVTAGDTGAVDEDVDLRILLRDIVRQGFAVGLFCDVALDKFSLPPSFFDLLFDFTSKLFIDVSDDDRHPGVRKEAGDARADAGGGSGDNGGLAVHPAKFVQIQHVCLSFI